MDFEEFQHLARLHVVGALDAEEQAAFDAACRLFGRRAEEYVEECRRLEAAFALSLTPARPHREAKSRLLSLIRASSQRRNGSGA